MITATNTTTTMVMMMMLTRIICGILSTHSSKTNFIWTWTKILRNRQRTGCMTLSRVGLDGETLEIRVTGAQSLVILLDVTVDMFCGVEQPLQEILGAQYHDMSQRHVLWCAVSEKISGNRCQLLGRCLEEMLGTASEATVTNVIITVF